jgi:polyvinyl alcohol dehydrogenase (cytochrome)
MLLIPGRAALAALAIACALPAAAADWPMANGLSGNHAQADEDIIGRDNVAGLAPRWVHTTAGLVNATPAVVDGAVYFPDAGGMVWKLDAATGEVLWSKAIPELTGIERAFSRTSPAVAGGMVFFAVNRGANLLGLDAATGERKWMTQLDPHPRALLTSSPVIVGDRIYMPVSSSEQGAAENDPEYPCCTFRGSMVALDIHTGEIAWKTFTMPENGGQPGGYSGGAALAIPAVDVEKGLIYFSTDHQYTQPAEAEACLVAAAGDWDKSCFADDAYFNAVIALDLETGAVRWSFFGSGTEVYQQACGGIPVPWDALARNYVGDQPGTRICPPPGDLLDWSFATGSPNLFTASIDGETRDLVGIGEKSGVFWALDAATGEVVWSRLVGPFSEPGGVTWGAAWDGERLYMTLTNADHTPHRLSSGEITDGGFWTALDPATGEILWQTAEPQGALVYAAPVVANGVVYVGSLAASGGQMLALAPDTGEVLWQFEAGGSVGAHPAVANGAVYWGSGFTLIEGSVANDKFYSFGVDGE